MAFATIESGEWNPSIYSEAVFITMALAISMIQGERVRAGEIHDICISRNMITANGQFGSLRMRLTGNQSEHSGTNYMYCWAGSLSGTELKLNHGSDAELMSIMTILIALPAGNYSH